MRSCTAFIKKEFLETVRTGKLLILAILFSLFGIMNPAIAKLTPWMMEMMADSLADTGLTITATEVNAMTSWTQFYKNIPLAMIMFLLMFSSIFTVEYQRGTLINMLTKGLERWKVMMAKALSMLIFWTCGYWLCYGITYGYTVYFWDNGVVSYPVFSAFCVYLLGIWLISLILLSSVPGRTNITVLILTGAVFGIVYLLSYLLNFVPDFVKVRDALPVQLLISDQLLTGAGKPGEYMGAVLVTVLWIVLNAAAAVVLFNRKEM